MKSRIQGEMVALSQVNDYVSKVSKDFKKILELVKMIVFRQNMKANEALLIYYF